MYECLLFDYICGHAWFKKNQMEAAIAKDLGLYLVHLTVKQGGEFYVPQLIG